MTRRSNNKTYKVGIQWVIRTMAEATITVDVELDRVDLIEMSRDDQIIVLENPDDEYQNIRIRLSEGAKSRVDHD